MLSGPWDSDTECMERSYNNCNERRPMLKLFQEVCRKKDYREVRGKKYDAITWRLDFYLI